MITRYATPFSNLSHWHREMDRAVRSMFGDTLFENAQRASGTARFPAVNLWETTDHVVAEAEVPGFSMADIDVAIERGELRIAAKRAAPAKEDAVFHRRERPLGEFTRTITLPNAVEVEHVSAELQNGVLTITMPKAAAAKPRKITVKETK